MAERRVADPIERIVAEALGDARRPCLPAEGSGMTAYSGIVQIGERAAKWRLNPARGGVIIEFDAFTLALTGEPSPEQIMCAIEGFLDGYVQGKQAGRSILQNEFRNLMGLQR